MNCGALISNYARKNKWKFKDTHKENKHSEINLNPKSLQEVLRLKQNFSKKQLLAKLPSL